MAMAKRWITMAEKTRTDGVRGCDWPGCTGAGEHRAPRSRSELRTYYWFCLQHIRLYNKNWNYYEGLDDDEVEADMRRDTTWARPTWPLGSGPGAKLTAGFDDPLGAFEAMRDGDAADPHKEGERTNGRFGAEAPFSTPEEDAQKVLELKGPVTPEAIKASYKRLVKQHHPDANGGDKEAEERIKQINAAYQTLMKSVGGRVAT